MNSRVSVLSAALCFLGPHCCQVAAQQSPQSDGAASFINDLRATAAEREVLFASGEDSPSKGHYREAEDTFQSLMVRYPASTRAIGDLARAYVAENRNDEVLAFLEGQVARQPSRQDILFTFVRVAVELNAYGPAITALGSARDRLPSNAVELARVLSVSGQEAEAAAPTQVMAAVLATEAGTVSRVRYPFHFRALSLEG